MRTLTKTEKNDSLLRMAGGSWTINLERVNLQHYDEIVYTTEDRRYVITTAEAIEKGFEMILGGERKLVVSLKHWHVSALSL
jgi:predicted  nucleic acid-binding Zn-ribbon protein